MSQIILTRRSRIKWEFPKLHPDQIRARDQIRGRKRAVLRCGRRWGKTLLFEDIAATCAFLGQKVGFFGPDYKRVLPAYKSTARLLGPSVAAKSKIDMLIETESRHGAGLVEFWTLNDENAGRSRDYDTVLIDEASLAPNLQEVFEQAIAPTLLDRDGRAIMAGTPKGIDPENYFYLACTDRSQGWHEIFAPTRLNPTLDQAAVQRLQNEYPPLVYQQEFLAEFVDWSGAAFFSQDSLLIDGEPVDYPEMCQSVFAVIDTAVKTGKKNDGTAVIFCAFWPISPTPLIILDWDVVQIEGALLEEWLPGVFARLEELSVECKALHGAPPVWIEDKSSGTILLQQAQKRQLAAEPIDSKLTALGKEERAINVSGYVYRGLVKISRYAFEKTVNFKGITRNHLLSQVVGFRVGQKDEPGKDDLLDTFTYSISLALGDGDGF